MSERADLLITGATIVTLDDRLGVIEDGALAVRGERISALGARTQIQARIDAAEVIDGRRFLLTPGLIDAHIHVTGDPLTRGYVPGHTSGDFDSLLTRYVLPRYLAQTADDERLSATLAAVEMLRSGTTCFLEAGTIRFLDAVVEGLLATGIRGRVGTWVEGRSDAEPRAAIDAAIRALEDEIARYPAAPGATIAAWPILVGHGTNPDDVWKAAKGLADAHGLGVSAHMSPYPTDAEWFLKATGRRPIEHLAHIGVLGDAVALTHVVHIDDEEARLLADTGTNVIHCPFAALKGAFGVSARGRFPELAQAGVNIALGTDGYASDLLQKTGLVAAMFKDARRDLSVFPAERVLAMATVNAARLLRMSEDIGVLRVGGLADVVMHDLDRPEWRPLLNPLEQLVFSADGRSVHSVWVGGVRVVHGYRCTLIDEEALYAEAQRAGEAIVRRSGIPRRPADAAG